MPQVMHIRDDETQDSGVEFIGMMPREWDLKPLKYLATCNDEVLPESTPADYVFDYIDIGSVYTGSGIKNVERMSFQNSPSRARRIVRDGDIVVSTVRTYLKAIAQVEKFEVPLIASTGFAVIRTERPLAYFLKYALLSDNFVSQVEANSVGISYPAINASRLMCFKIPVPPPCEQTAIAEYLDDKCAAINEIITEAKATIEEYKAWKSSVIFEAVTKGLDPNAEMKDSGVEWIGKVSKDFDVIKLKYLIAGYKAGPFGSALITNALLPNGETLVYTPEHIALKTAQSEKNLYLPQTRADEMSQFFVEPDDIIFPIVGSLGRAMQITEDMPRGIINQRLAKFRLDKKLVDETYFMWLFANSSFYAPYIDLYQRGSIIVNLTKTIIEEMPFILPELSMQRKISNYLDEKCAAIDAIIAEKEALIADMESYKKSLIFETVTGKRRVV